MELSCGLGFTSVFENPVVSSMADWDADEFEVPAGRVDDRWEGEDEEDEDLGNWDDSEEEKEEAPKVVVAEQPPKKGGKKAMKQLLKEKEEKEKAEREARAAAIAAKTPEEILSDKMLAQKLAEDSDFEVTREMFASKPTDPSLVTLDNFKPATKEEFKKMTEMIQKKLMSLESSPHYFFLLDSVLSKAMLPLTPEDLRKLATSFNVLANEKTKLEKSKKGKKSTKAKLGGVTKASSSAKVVDDYSNDYDDFDDFM